LAILQSRIHESWARTFGSSLKDDLNYSPTDCFETFPFPKDWQTNQSLEQAGETYYEYRAALMIRNDEGLTKTYNRFHDPDEDNPEILKLRELHAIMDHAVLEAYGWHDLAERATCGFQLEYEEPEDEDEDDSGRKRKKKPWRYKWPQDFHDEVLARLLELNQIYAEQERIAGESAVSKPKTTKKPSKKKSSKKPPDQVQLILGGDQESE
jgi:hypothetical protein